MKSLYYTELSLKIYKILNDQTVIEYLRNQDEEHLIYVKSKFITENIPESVSSKLTDICSKYDNNFWNNFRNDYIFQTSDFKEDYVSKMVDSMKTRLQTAKSANCNENIIFSCKLTEIVEREELFGFEQLLLLESPLIKLEFMSLKNHIIVIENLDYLKMKLFENPNYNIFEDDEYKRNADEAFKILNDLQTKHLTKVGSNYFVQSAYMERFIKSIYDSTDLTILVFVFEMESLNRLAGFYWRTNLRMFKFSKSVKINGLNMKFNFEQVGYGKMKSFKKEWTIPIENLEKLKTFMRPEIVNMKQTENTHQGVYLIQLNCDDGTNKYKIGKSKNLLTRLKSTEYRNAYIFMAIHVNNDDACEKELITKFSEKFTQIRTDSTGNFGNETFAGNINEMMYMFWNICSRYM